MTVRLFDHRAPESSACVAAAHVPYSARCVCMTAPTGDAAETGVSALVLAGLEDGSILSFDTSKGACCV